MKIRQLTLMAGPKGVVQPGQVVEVTAKEGKARIKAGVAVAVPDKRETATSTQAKDKETTAVE